MNVFKDIFFGLVLVLLTVTTVRAESNKNSYLQEKPFPLSFSQTTNVLSFSSLPRMKMSNQMISMTIVRKVIKHKRIRD